MARSGRKLSNRLTINDLLNPLTEGEVVPRNVTDDEIVTSVREMREAEQMMEIMDGDNTNGGEFATTSRGDALKASLTLRNYISDLDEPFARKLEAMLSDFGHQTRFDIEQKLQPSYITDYFTSNHL